MTEIRWEQYPLVARHELARKWLQRQVHLQLAPNTIDAYGRCLNDYLNFCARHDTQPEAVTRDLVAQYVQDLASRPNPKGANIIGANLSNRLWEGPQERRSQEALLDPRQEPEPLVDSSTRAGTEKAPQTW